MNGKDAKEKLDGCRSTMLERMIETAQQGDCISYSKLIHGSGVESFLDLSDVRNAMSAVLHSIGLEVNKQEVNVMLTAVVVHKNDLHPGVGFYDLAVELGKLPPNSSKDDKEKFWINELKKVHQYYQEEK